MREPFSFNYCGMVGGRGAGVKGAVAARSGGSPKNGSGTGGGAITGRSPDDRKSRTGPQNRRPGQTTAPRTGIFVPPGLDRTALGIYHGPGTRQGNDAWT